MATLTYDPTPADQPEFTPEEQDSIAVGEQLEQQQNQLLAGKYQNAQELEKAYVELQRKLGSQNEEEGSDGRSIDSETETSETDESDEASNDSETDASETDESDEESKKDDVKTTTISQDDVDTLMNLVGGKEAYANMISWASETMTKQEIEMFDYVMDLDNPWAAFFAVKTVQTAYENSVGKDGRMLTGKSAPNTKDEFRSQAEVIQAMADPRYESDPAYRNDVFQKLDRSNIDF